MEKGEGPDLKKKFNIQTYPTFLIIDLNGNLMYQFSGSCNTKKFIENVYEIFNKTQTL